MFGGGGFGGGGFQGFGEPEAPDTRARLTIALEASYSGDERQISIGGRSLKVRIPQGVTAGPTTLLARQRPRGGGLVARHELATPPQRKKTGQKNGRRTES